jgi:hypothetical protein
MIVAFSLLAVFLAGSMGCQTSKKNYRPPVVEEINLPPTDDARTVQAPTYPKEPVKLPYQEKQQRESMANRFTRGTGGP